MSKLKTPPEKKLASLVLDRRNVYGEDTHASRAGIPRSKQLSHKTQRRASRQPLAACGAAGHAFEAAEVDVLERELKARRKAFRKRPDAPIGHILDAKKLGLSKFQHWMSEGDERSRASRLRYGNSLLEHSSK